ncbi:MAG: type II toxin-antitoxin system CcdA family antitoxin [Pacificimonas sp.]
MAVMSAERERPSRKATNVSLDSRLLEDAKALSLNISRACEAGLASQVKQARAEKWQQHNRAAIDAFNACVDEKGILLEEHRMF